MSDPNGASSSDSVGIDAAADPAGTAAEHAGTAAGGAGPATDFSVGVSDLPGGVCCVSVVGAVDLLTAPSVDEAVLQAQRDSSAVRLDLRGVSFLGSAGLSVLVDAARRADAEASRLAIVASGHTVLRAIEVTGLDSVLRLFDSADSADEYLLG